MSQTSIASGIVSTSAASHLRRLVALSVLGFAALTVTASADEPVPDRASLRKQIDTLISDAPTHRATLGRIRAACALSIAFGAPAWNSGDHQACSDFYVQTAQALCAAFPKPEQASPETRAILSDLKSSLDRVKGSTDADAKAWAMRFVFDKAEVTVGVEIERCLRLQQLGQDCVKRSQFEEAVNAFADATATLRELDGQPLQDIPPLCRYAPLALCDALFGARQYAQSAAALEEGLRFVPEWPVDGVDLRSHFGDPAVYKLLFERLQDAALQHPDDAQVQLLVGYHLYMTGQHAAAKPIFEKAIKLAPGSAGAKRMLEEYDPNRPKRTLPPADTDRRGLGTS